MDQFSLLLTLLDTLPDFLLYLDVRHTLHQHKLIPSNSDPIDEWAFTMFEKQKLVEVLESPTFQDLSGTYERHRDSVKKLEESERFSYLVDALVERLSATVGREVPVDPRLLKYSELLESPNSLGAYHRLIPCIARLNRKQRCQLMDRLLICISRCGTQPLSFSGLKFTEYEEGYLVLASTENRYERQVALFNLGRVFGFKMKLDHVVCLASDSRDPGFLPSDVMLIDLSKMKIDDRLIQASEELFAPPKR